MTADLSPMNISTLAFEPPIPRLFGAPLVEPNALRTNQIGVVGMPSDWTHSSRIGTRFGPRALRQATTVWMKGLSALIGEPLVDAATGLCWRVRRDRWLGDCGDAHISPASVGRTTAAIARMTRAIRAQGAVPLALGGDHYNSYPACLGYSQGLADLDHRLRFGFIQIDGHLDFSDRLGAWGAHNHATNARRISELPNITKANMVWIGITGWVDSGELAEIERMGGLVLSSADVHRLGPAETAKRGLAHATRNCESLYLSIDIDAMDAGYLPGTGSIVHSAITPRQYCQLLDGLAVGPIDGLDIVEVSPPLDPSGRTERIAAEMLARILRHRMLEAA